MDNGGQLAHAPSGAQWTIEADGQRAVVVEVGGGLRGYTSGGADVLDGYEADEICPGSAGSILAPWPNRIRDGKYSFGGHQWQLPITEPARHNAMHGLTRWARWRRAERAEGAVTVEYELVPQPGYPWPLLLRTTWSLGPTGLTAAHSATNLGTEPCPFGLAAHPYLRVPGVPVDELRLRLRAGSRLLVDARLLPIGAARVAGGEFDFAAGPPIGAKVLDVAFGNIEQDPQGRSVAVLTADDGRGVEVWADGSFGWWQVFTGDTLAPARRRRSVALEPMTCPPDAFRSGRDLVVIEPGQSWLGTWGIRPIG